MIFLLQPLHLLIVAPGHSCDLLMEGALDGAVIVLVLECKPCLDHVLNWPKIRLLPAVDKWTDLGLLRAILVSDTWDVGRCCQNIFFYFLQTLFFLILSSHFFNVINPKRNLKVKYTFKNAFFHYKKGSCLLMDHSIRIYPQKYLCASSSRIHMMGGYKPSILHWD